MTGLLILLGVVILLIIYVISLYNKIVRLKTTRENALSDIDVQMKMRFDLVDNLVSTVKGYAAHEKETLDAVIKARNNFGKAKDMEGKAKADGELSSALKSIFALAESYPDLKANQNFLQLQTELSDIENKIAAARRFFNATTKEYNTTIQQFPANIIFSGNKPETFFEGEEEIKKAPKVEF
ncbi:MAG: LemA family protein [Candidatus Absconditabacteria bacterium]|nr:LemA family protein [Candidatus Absconditabacteria bacterium]MDD3868474.1 LemA family protein [Candidatus Absconditabacteria bacterium]MDD4713952.1 LemA family protein [Candidatus Absconditabacteria bacterium]